MRILPFVTECYVFTSLSGAVAYTTYEGGLQINPVHLEYVACSGSEDALVNCIHSPLGELSSGYCVDYPAEYAVYCPRKLYRYHSQLQH